MLEKFNPFRRIGSPITRLYSIKGISTILFWIIIIFSRWSFGHLLGGYFILSIIALFLLKFFLDTYLMLKIREQEFIESQLQLMGHHMEIIEEIKKNIEIQTKIEVQKYKNGVK